MGAKRKTKDMITNTDEVKIVAAAEATTTEQAPTAAPVKKKAARLRSKKYRAVRAQIDKTKKYDPFAAVELMKKLSYTQFAGTVTAHVVVRETGATVSLAFPHSTGKTVRVTIVDDEVLKNIEKGQLDFDVLVAHPQYMGKIAKFAAVLGPKGLMPNPKNGTLTPNPELQKKKLEAGTITIKTEKKAPLMHVMIGKTSMETKALVENIEALIRALDTKLESLVIAATMSPGIKINATSSSKV